MAPVRVHYPHFTASHQPRWLSREDIWTVAQHVRDQLCPQPRRPWIDSRLTMKRCGRIIVNDVELEVYFEIGSGITDGSGAAALGCTEHYERWPGRVSIHLNGNLIGEREDLFRSTLAHEIGHVVFDAPSWVKASGLRTPAPQHMAGARTRHLYSEGKTAEIGIDRREWRANEFMGAFLAPNALLHGSLVKRAAARGLPLRAYDADLPVLDAQHVDDDTLSALIFELAELFGLSDSFIATRLRKYGLIYRARSPRSL